MDRPPSRRDFLLSGIGAAALGLAGCSSNKEGGATEDSDSPTPNDTGSPTLSATDTPTDTQTKTEAETETATPENQWEIDPLEHDTLIGANYYVWYNSDSWWEDWLRRVPAKPVLGEYSSADEDVVNQHIKWAREYGINWFNTSWWGPGSDEDRILRENVFEAELAEYMDFSILYESPGRFEPNENRRLDFDMFQNPRQLQRDFEYLELEYFGRDNYLEIDGRPVVFVYLAHSFAGDVRKAFQEAKDAIDSDPYLIADVLSNGTAYIQKEWIDEFDAVSTYNIYSQQIAEEGDFSDFVPYATKRNADWVLAGDNADIDIFPNIIPGYNDSIYRDNPILERDPRGFQKLAGNLMNQLDSGLNAVMVTSANEWPEYTAVFPAESYGATYLDIIREEMAEAEPTSLSSDEFDELEFDFNEAITPSSVNPDNSDSRALSFMLGKIELQDGGGEPYVTYDIGVPRAEPYIVEGAYAPGSDEETALKHWRWLGGDQARSTVLFDIDIDEPTSAEISGLPMVSDEIEADVYFNGQQTDHIAFGDRAPQTYAVSLSR